MSNEDKIQKEIAEYQKLAAQDPKVDIAALAINALQKHESNLIPYKQKRMGYIISLVAPPFGLGFALKFILSDKDDAKEAALMCVGLTVLSAVLTIVLFKSMLSGSGTSLQQIHDIKPEQIQELYQ